MKEFVDKFILKNIEVRKKNSYIYIYNIAISKNINLTI